MQEGPTREDDIRKELKEIRLRRMILKDELRGIVGERYIRELIEGCSMEGNEDMKEHFIKTCDVDNFIIIKGHSDLWDVTTHTITTRWLEFECDLVFHYCEYTSTWTRCGREIKGSIKDITMNVAVEELREEYDNDKDGTWFQELFTSYIMRDLFDEHADRARLIKNDLFVKKER